MYSRSSRPTKKRARCTWTSVRSGNPVIVGVNEGGKLATATVDGAVQVINKGITNHYVVIYGFKEVEQADGSWKVTELYGMDNATAGSWRDSRETWPHFEVEASGRVV